MKYVPNEELEKIDEIKDKIVSQLNKLVEVGDTDA